MTDKEIFEAARKKIGVYALARMLDVYSSTIYNYLNGRTVPPPEMVAAVEQLLASGEIDREQSRLAEQRKAKMQKVLAKNKANITAEDRRAWQKKAVESRLRRRGES